jgi:hemerythrin
MKQIDPFAKEHGAIFGLLNQLTPAMRAPHAVIGGLLDHMSIHFIDEDRLMRRAHYPGREKHVEDHTLIQDLFLAHIPRLVSGNISQDELDILMERLVLHVKTEDFNMMKYICTYAEEVLTPDEIDPLK